MKRARENQKLKLESSDFRYDVGYKNPVLFQRIKNNKQQAENLIRNISVSILNL
jgi:hypothetical protein